MGWQEKKWEEMEKAEKQLLLFFYLQDPSGYKNDGANEKISTTKEWDFTFCISNKIIIILI